MSNGTLLVTMSIADLELLIRNSIKLELKEILNSFHSPPQDDLIGIDETAILLKVSKVTIHKYKKDKRLKPYRIGRKVYFKKQEVLDSMNNKK